MSQLIRPSFAFTKMTPADLVSFLSKVFAGIKDNPAFKVNLPVDMATFKAAIDSYSSAVTEAANGGKKEIAQRNHEREVVIKMLRQLAHYVEAACKDDMTVFVSSGFQVRPSAHTAKKPLSQYIKAIDPGGNSGQVVVSVAAVRGAHSYEVRWAPAGTSLTATTWTNKSIGKTRPKLVAENLTPGTAYLFQARVLTPAGFTDWSDPITRICT